MVREGEGAAGGVSVEASEGEPWTEVKRRARSREGGRFVAQPEVAGRRSTGPKNGDGQTSYFFTAFPDYYNARHMWNIFKLYGKISEVYIPAKRDRRGARFGFVRFEGVQDPRVLGLKLNQIFIGQRKLIVNTPAYKRGEVKTDKYLQDNGRRSSKQIAQSRVQGHNKVANVGTYAHVVKQNWMENNEGPGNKQRLKEKEFAHLGFQTKPELVNILQRAYVGYVVKPGDSYRTHQNLSMEGIFGIKATPLGPTLVLLETDESKDVAEYLNKDVGWVLEWFEEIKGWTKNTVDRQRKVWLKSFGIPLHAWDEDFFKVIGTTYGQFITVDDETKNRTRLDRARLTVNTSLQSPINESFRA